MIARTVLVSKADRVYCFRGVRLLTEVVAMAPRNNQPPVELIDHAIIDRAHEKANREALLEHARMGRSVFESRDGKIVTVTPAEIFARYGLDENGKPKSE